MTQEFLTTAEELYAALTEQEVNVTQVFWNFNSYNQRACNFNETANGRANAKGKLYYPIQ